MYHDTRGLEVEGDIHCYDDIIGLPHHVSGTRAHMPVSDRAAQFSPFAALTGYDDAIRETARLVDEKMELDEDEKALLNEKLLFLQEQIAAHPAVKITYFRPDAKKAGGFYVQAAGMVKKIDVYRNRIVMEDKTEIAIGDILEISGEIFGPLEEESHV